MATAVPLLRAATLERLATNSTLLPLVVILTCLTDHRHRQQQGPQPPCAGEAAHSALAAATAIAGFEGRLSFAYAGGLPAADLGFSYHRLPAAVVLKFDGVYVDAQQAPAPAAEEEATAWLASFCNAFLSGAVPLFTRLRPPPPVVPTWLSPHVARETTAITLDVDLAGAGRCALLLVHDSSAAEASTGREAQLARWHALVATLAEEPAFAGSPPSLLHLDASLSDVTRGSKLGQQLQEVGLPAYLAVTHYFPGFVFTPVLARRVRSSAALEQWARSHLQSPSCSLPRPAAAPPTTTMTRPTTMPMASTQPPEAAAAVAASDPHAWLRRFVADGMPAAERALHAHLRRRLDTRVMLNVLEAHVAHGAVMGAPRVAPDVAVARSAGLEWAQDNEDAVRWLLHHALTGEGAEAAVAMGRSEAAAAEAEAAAVAGSRVEAEQRRHQRRLGWVRAARIRTAAARQWHEELEAVQTYSTSTL